MSRYELIVRKKLSQFIEKEFRYFNLDFNHDTYKKIVYGEIGAQTPLEEKLKAYYDAYVYLLNNAKSPLTKQVLNRFFYLLFLEPVNDMIMLHIQTRLLQLCECSPIEKACEFHMYVFKMLDQYPDLTRQIVSLMFFNYVLVKHDIPAIKLVGREIYEYVGKRNNYENNKEDMFLFFKKIVKNSYVLKKSYLDNVTDITVKDIYNTINGMKDTLVEKYCVDNIYLYGSFAKGTNRHDSDIDLLVKLSADMPYDDRVVTIEQLKQLFFTTFKRFTDIEEVREFFTEDFIKEATKIKRIF